MSGRANEERSLLIVDDDEVFRTRLARAMAERGFSVGTAESVATGIKAAERQPPAFAVIDLKLGDGSGLDLVEIVRSKRPDARIVMLTGYGAIASAVVAIKAGAVDYLAKPATADEIQAALLGGRQAKPAALEPMSADRVWWEHIQRVFELCDRNVSETARRLKMHRRTLQRILAKRSPP
jgi:two-component system response regulator RegA